VNPKVLIDIIMYRYEKAWQRLFRDESRLGNPIYGTLTLTRNHPELEVMHNGPDDLPWKSFKWEEIETKLRKDGLNTSPEDITKKYGFISFNIGYNIKLDHSRSSWILDGKLSECHEVFYPFLRPFFHRAENELDKLLYNRLFEAAKPKITKEDFSYTAGEGQESSGLHSTGVTQIRHAADSSYFLKSEN
jgi:hypothetical protein